MIIFPAIDIKDGKCVRLIKGDFNKIISYEDSPANQAIKYSQSGFGDIHIVDLDGALQGKPVNSIIVKEIIKKVKEGSPHIVDSLLSNDINLVINTTKTQGSIRDSYSIRRTSLMNNIPYYTTIAGAKVAVDAIESLKNHALTVQSIQSIH